MSNEEGEVKRCSDRLDRSYGARSDQTIVSHSRLKLGASIDREALALDQSLS